MEQAQFQAAKQAARQKAQSGGGTAAPASQPADVRIDGESSLDLSDFDRLSNLF